MSESDASLLEYARVMASTEDESCCTVEWIEVVASDILSNLSLILSSEATKLSLSS